MGKVLEEANNLFELASYYSRQSFTHGLSFMFSEQAQWLTTGH